MYGYHKSVAASQAKCMFWLLTALKDDLFPEPVTSAIPVRQLSYEATHWERGQFIDFTFSRAVK